jgi:hypothetical protein
MKTTTRRIVAAGSFWLVALASAQSAPAIPPDADSREILELPPVNVTVAPDLPPPESWRYARIDGFEVLANASERKARRLLRDFQLFRQALQLVRPAAVPPNLPATLILCDRPRDFGRFVPTDQQGAVEIVSLLLRDRERAAIVADLERNVLHLEDVSVMRRSGQSARTDADDSRYEALEVEPHRQLYRQYARLLLTQGEVGLPPWLLEGVTQLVMDLNFSDRSVRYGWLNATQGAPLPAFLDPYGPPLDVSSGPSGGSGSAGGMDAGSMIAALSGTSAVVGEPAGVVGDRPFPLVLANVPLLPMDEFFAVTADSPAALNPIGNSLWAKQAYAFVHLCQFRADGRFRQPFDRFVRRLAREPLTEALFQECFGLDYAGMLRELSAYIRYPRHQYRDIRLTAEGRFTAPEVAFREATQGEVARIKGDAQRLAGRHDEALVTLRTAYARGEREVALLAALGVVEHHAGQKERARRFLEVAAKLGTDRPSAWVALARLRLDEAQARPAEAGGLSAAQVAAVLTPLLKARTLQPALPDVYTVMAETWMLSAAPPTPANIHVVGEGAMRFPFDSALTMRTAQLYARAGDLRDAAEVARMGLRFAADAATRARLDEFLANLPPSPSVGPPPDGEARDPTS